MTCPGQNVTRSEKRLTGGSGPEGLEFKFKCIGATWQLYAKKTKLWKIQSAYSNAAAIYVYDNLNVFVASSYHQSYPSGGPSRAAMQSARKRSALESSDHDIASQASGTAADDPECRLRQPTRSKKKQQRQKQHQQAQTADWVCEVCDKAIDGSNEHNINAHLNSRPHLKKLMAREASHGQKTIAHFWKVRTIHNHHPSIGQAMPKFSTQTFRMLIRAIGAGCKHLQAAAAAAAG